MLQKHTRDEQKICARLTPASDRLQVVKALLKWCGLSLRRVCQLGQALVPFLIAVRQE